MSWFEKLMPSRISTEKRTRSVPQGVWMKCADLRRATLPQGGRAQPGRLPQVWSSHAYRRQATPGIFSSMKTRMKSSRPDLEPLDPLKFRDSKRYRDRISQAQKKTGEKDALVTMKGTLERSRSRRRPHSSSISWAGQWGRSSESDSRRAATNTAAESRAYR